MTSNLRGRHCCAADCSSGLQHLHPSHSLLSCALGDDSIRLFDFPLQLFVPRQCPGSWCATCHLHLLLGTYFTSLARSVCSPQSVLAPSNAMFYSFGMPGEAIPIEVPMISAITQIFIFGKGKEVKSVVHPKTLWCSEPVFFFCVIKNFFQWSHFSYKGFWTLKAVDSFFNEVIIIWVSNVVNCSCKLVLHFSLCKFHI